MRHIFGWKWLKIAKQVGLNIIAYRLIFFNICSFDIQLHDNEYFISVKPSIFFGQIEFSFEVSWWKKDVFAGQPGFKEE